MYTEQKAGLITGIFIINMLNYFTVQKMLFTTLNKRNKGILKQKYKKKNLLLTIKRGGAGVLNLTQ